jgi:HTH-type transcriptional regulator/antitoxin HigA
MRIKPIKTEEDYQEALKLIEKLWEANPDTPEGDKLDVLTTLVEVYEEKADKIFPPDPVEAIKFRMEQLGLSKTDMAPYLGGKNRVSEVLQKKRNLTVRMMKKLHKELEIPAESLLTS